MPISWEWQRKVDGIIKPYGKQRWSDTAKEKALAALNGKANPVVLEAGCGKECWITRSLRESITSLRVIGVDIDEDCLNNPDVDEAHVASICEMPVKDESVDLIVSGYVLEHLEDPESAFREMNRVLKPGGMVIAWTPNLYSPYSIVSYLTPHWAHTGVRMLTWGKQEAENAPTFYRANTVGRIRKLAQLTGFGVESSAYCATGYSYFRMSKPTYIVAATMARLLSLLPLGFFKHTIFCVLIKTPK